MSLIDAALSACYPVIFIMGGLIWMRFFPLLQAVEPRTKPLICSMLVIVTGVMWESLMYGYGRFSGTYITIATAPLLVSLGKILYMGGFSYLIYAFWLLAPSKARLSVSLAFTGVVWVVITALLMV